MRQPTLGRTAKVVGMGVAAGVVALGSVAWACTEAMMGDVWACPTSAVSPACQPPPTTTQTFAAANVSAWSRALGLSRGFTEFRLVYVGGHGATQQDNCMNAVGVTSLGLFTTNAYGHWKGKQFTLPPVGTYTQCVNYPTTGATTDSNQHSSLYQNFTVT